MKKSGSSGGKPERRRAKLTAFWKSIDWKRRDCDIARQFGVTRASVHEVRAKLYAAKLIDTDRHRAKKSRFDRDNHTHAILLEITLSGSVIVRAPTLYEDASLRERGVVCALRDVPGKISEIVTGPLYKKVREITSSGQMRPL